MIRVRVRLVIRFSVCTVGKLLCTRICATLGCNCHACTGLKLGLTGTVPISNIQKVEHSEKPTCRVSV